MVPCGMEGRPEGSDMSKRFPRCAACGDPFHPDRYNGDRQRYCTGRKCVLDRARGRRRKSYAKRYHTDPGFAEKERKRCAEANSRRRAAARAARSPPPTPAPQPASLFDVLAGVVSQLTDTDDPVLLRSSLHRYERRGRRMTVAMDAGPDPP